MKIHLYPSKMRKNFFGQTNGTANDGFFIRKGENDDYWLGYNINGNTKEIRINKKTYNALKQQAKENFEKYGIMKEEGEEFDKSKITIT